MNFKTTLKVSVPGILFLFAFLFLGSNNLLAANGGDDCDNEMIVSGNAKTVTYNWGVQYAWKIKGAPNGYGARFYDNGDKVVVKLDELVKEGEKIFVTLKMRDYNSSYSGPIRCKVYESEDGYNWSYNNTIKTEVKSYYVEKMFSVDGDTKYLKLVNGSSYQHGSPDFLVDGLSFEYSMCLDHCPDGPEPGSPCDDGDSSTTGDVINDDCECEGTEVVGGTFTVCSRIDASNDDAEENLLNGAVNTTSGDLEFILDGTPPNGPFINQMVGMRFNNLNIPNGATITNAFIQFTADATVDVDPCNLNIRGEASNNAAPFSTSNANISSRAKTSASVPWSPADWINIGDHGAAQQTSDIAAVIQEIVNRNGYVEGNSIAIFIDGIGKRTAKSFDGSDSHAPNLCVTFQTGCHDSDNDGVCDDDDICEGGDDNIDVDNDGIPDGCDDCINEEHVEGNGVCVSSNWGVSYAHKILGAPDDQGAKFFDHGDKLVVKLDDCVEKDQKIIVTLKRRDYNSSYDGPIKLKVYESKHGYCWSYNKTITTEVKSYYVEKMFSVDGDTKYLKLVNGSSCYNGSPDFYVDAVSYDYTICDEVPLCPNGAAPGSACDDGNDLTINDKINGNCECVGTLLANFDVCAQIAASSDDAEEKAADGSINLTSGDIELLYDNSHGAHQTVGLRFLDLDIPNGAIINSAYIQFTSEATINQDPTLIKIYGEATDDAGTFVKTIDYNITSRVKTTTSVNWTPPTWETTGVAGPDQQTPDMAAIIQEIVSRPGFNSNSAISIIIEGYGKRTAVAFDYDAHEAAELCINFSAPLDGNGNLVGMGSNGSGADGAGPSLVASNGDSDTGTDPVIELTGDIENITIEDAPEMVRVDPSSVKIYPIPAYDDVNINLTGHEGRPARISVYNQLGQLQEIVDLEAIPASPLQLSLENYQNGTFYMNIEVENAAMITKKFIVSKTY